MKAGSKRGYRFKEGVDRGTLLLSLIFILLALSTSLFGKGFLSFKITFSFWLVSYLFLAYRILSVKAPERISRLLGRYTLPVLFAASLVLHIIFLFRSPSMSQDVFRMERRGEMLLSGAFPYADFNVNKPPLYIWLVGLISLPFGPEQLFFRMVFSVADSLVPVVLFLIGKVSPEKGHSSGLVSEKITVPPIGWKGAAFLYALCPIPLLETALAGHFDAVVVIMTLLSFHFLFGNRAFLAGLFLGTGFSLKLYPMFIAPFFFFTLKRWKERFILFAGFWVVPVASSIPVLLRDPSLILGYVRYQFTGWYSGFSVRSVIEIFFDAISVSPGSVGPLMTLLLMASLLLLLVHGLRRRTDRISALIPFAMLMVLGAVGIVLTAVMVGDGANSFSMIIAGIVITAFQIALLTTSFHMFLTWKSDREIDPGVENKLPGSSIDASDLAFLSSCVLMTLILTSAQFHPWYILWVLPLAFASGRGKWTWITLLGLASVAVGYYLPWELGGF